MTIRSFIALAIPEDTVNELGDLAAKMSYQDKSNAVRWQDQENYHVTLAFLGEQTEHDLDRLTENLDEHVQQVEFLARASRLSPFPESKPKLLAAMVDKTDDWIALNQQVLAAVRATGLVADKRRFQPHITLGRFRHTRNRYVGTIPTLSDLEFFAQELVLYESILSASGAHYEALVRFPLDQFSYDDVAYD